MNIRDIGNICIVDVCKDTISQSDVRKLREILKDKPRLRRLGVNMRNVRQVDNSFYNFVKDWIKDKKSKAALFNTETPVFFFFYVSGMDSFINIYLDKNDFCNDKRVIVKRRLKLLKSA